MDKTFVAHATTIIHAPPAQVWRAITQPDLIKQYLFGSEVVTAWQVGSPILYRGMWQGKPFEDKGTVLRVEPEKLLQVTHWSPLSGVPDIPENYHTVTYTLAPEDDGTRVTISQDNNASQDEANHSRQNWQVALDNLKKLLER